MLVQLSTSEDQPEDAPYCALRYRRLCQGKGQHVACQFFSSVPGEACQNFTKIKFDNDLKHFIIHYINRRRQRLASGIERVRGGAHIPKPQVMLQVAWDRELAYLAQRLANQCNFVHDDCRATVRYPYAGQTVGEVKWRRSRESDTQSAQRAIRRIFDAWWGEKRRVQPKHLIQPFRITSRGNVFGHFTQLAVWNLCAVGCGAVRHVDKYPRLLLVCDFSHTNMLGQKTINPGPLAKCPLHTVRKSRSLYPLLCVPVHDAADTKANEGYQETNYSDDPYEDIEEEYGSEDAITTATELNSHNVPFQENYNSTEAKALIVNPSEGRLELVEDYTVSAKPKSEKDRAKINIMKKKKAFSPVSDIRSSHKKIDETEDDDYTTRRVKATFVSEEQSGNEHVFKSNNRDFYKQNRHEWRPSHRWTQQQRNRPDR
ncbi:uncharacterized protein LOC113232619 [Hyposmocoma kahamanoa]|uniref:uncharacterized protein LOC113232619 n=1 Tax=Hyposmocoma kahamanoa TaxID=1477025 RepID=UPI000E6D662F|nr:uncharacterized protein LOC113232619 [Hyposmocoma kahamanoa]